MPGKIKSMNVCFDLEIVQGVPESSHDLSKGLYKLGSIFPNRFYISFIGRINLELHNYPGLVSCVTGIKTMHY